MKKFLLSIAALAMSFAASAQVDVQHQRVGVVEQSPYFAQQSAVVHKAAKRIAANQRCGLLQFGCFSCCTQGHGHLQLSRRQQGCNLFV